MNFIICSRSATTVSNPQCACVPREKDHVRRWACEFCSTILFIFNRSSARQTVPETWPDPLPLCSVETKVESSSAKKEKIGMSLAKKQQRQLEKEVHWWSNFYNWLVLLCCISQCYICPHNSSFAVTGGLKCFVYVRVINCIVNVSYGPLKCWSGMIELKLQLCSILQLPLLLYLILASATTWK